MGAHKSLAHEALVIGAHGKVEANDVVVCLAHRAVKRGRHIELVADDILGVRRVGRASGERHSLLEIAMNECGEAQLAKDRRGTCTRARVADDEEIGTRRLPRHATRAWHEVTAERRACRDHSRLRQAVARSSYAHLSPE